jgi:hypothetical protein
MGIVLVLLLLGQGICINQKLNIDIYFKKSCLLYELRSN